MTRNDKGQFGKERELDEHDELYQEYGGWLAIHIDNERTVTRRKAGAEAWLEWCEEEKCDPLEADEDDVRGFIRGMLRDELADATISSRFASVSKFYHWLTTDTTRDDDIDENPCADISLAKHYDISNSSEYVSVIHREGREDIIAPGYESLKPLFDHVPGGTGFTKIRNELICRLFWQTAVRSDELSRVRLDNVDLDAREIKIRSSKLNRDDHPDLYKRIVFFESNLDYLVRRYLDKRGEKDPDGDSPYLLIGDRGGQLDSSYLSRIVKRAAHNAGIQEPLVSDGDDVQQWLFTAHRLRHARLTQLANKTDMDINHIRMLAGHAQIETTVTYVSPDWDEVRHSFRDATQ